MSLEQSGNIHLSPNTPVGRRLRKVCLGNLNKDIVLKSKMKHVVTYDVYLDILLAGSIYVTKY